MLANSGKRRWLFGNAKRLFALACRALSFRWPQCFSYEDTLMATPALLYRPNARWLICLAFGCAAVLHLAAIDLARNEAQLLSSPPPTDRGVDLEIEPTADQTPVQLEPSPVEPPEFVKADEEFPEERSTPAPTPAKNRRPISRFVRSASVTGLSVPSFGSVKVLAIYAPRPAYPYEARRQRTTGSGLVLLVIDLATGRVTDARIAESTGSVILDNSAVSALRTWRFKSGTVTRVHVPITYTLSGASY
jgi:TonB family protein